MFVDIEGMVGKLVPDWLEVQECDMAPQCTATGQDQV